MVDVWQHLFGYQLFVYMVHTQNTKMKAFLSNLGLIKQLGRPNGFSKTATATWILLKKINK